MPVHTHHTAHTLPPHLHIPCPQALCPRVLPILKDVLLQVHRLWSQRGEIVISPPVQVRDQLYGFWDVAARMPPSSLLPHATYARQPLPVGPWHLHTSAPHVPMLAVRAHTCPACSRPQIPGAVLVASGDGLHQPLKQAFCPDPTSSASLLTKSFHQRCRVLVPGDQVCRAVDDTASPWGHPCCPRSPTPCQPVPSLFRYLTPPQSSPVPRKLQALRVLGANLGGLQGQIDLLLIWIRVVDPDIVLFQELWNVSLLQDVLPPSYTMLPGSVEGQGRGLAIAWRHSLCAPGCRPEALRDARTDLVTLLQTRVYGPVLAGTVHFPPKQPARACHAVMRTWSALRQTLHPKYAIFQGDFNMSRAAGTPLEQALRPSGALAAFSPLLPPDCATNFCTVDGTPTATAIDHLLLHGACAHREHHLLPLCRTHVAVYAALHLQDARPDPFSWKLYRWRATEAAITRTLAIILSIAWGSLTHSHASPDQYLDIFHHYAQQMVRLREAPASLLDSLRLPPPPLLAIPATCCHRDPPCPSNRT